MEKYQSLIGKTINLEFKGVLINSYRITSMRDTGDQMWGRGRLYSCLVDWSNKDISAGYERVDFDEKTLDDLLYNNVAYSPESTDMLFRIIDKTNQPS